MKEAIQKAIEGGWPENNVENWAEAEIRESPLFWQALGKTLGWKETNLAMSSGGDMYTLHEWMMQWHNFVDHLIQGKDAESFFNNLLK